MTNKNTSVAIVIDTLNGGGAEKVCLTLAKYLNRLGARCQLVVIKKRVDYQLPVDLRVHYIFEDEKTSLYRRKNIKIAAESLKTLGNKENYDLVLSNLDGAHPVCKLANLKNTWYVVHNSIKEKLKRAFLLGPIKYFRQRGIYNNFNGEKLIVVSRGIENEILQERPVKPRSLIRIYNPLDREEITQLALGLEEDADKDIEQKNQPKENSDPSRLPKGEYIVHVGRFARMKRHDILFKAMALVPEATKLVLLCKASKKLARAIAKEGLEKRVIVAGFQQNPYRWIKNARLLALSSEAEGFGMVLVEALACDTPVVSTDCRHGPSEILKGKLQRYLSPVGDYKTLAKNINEVLQNPPKCLNAEILGELDAQTIAKKYLSLAEC